MKKKRCEIAFRKAKKEFKDLHQLNDNQYVDLYYGNSRNFNLVPEIPYAWQTKNEPILLPATRGKSVSVFGLMNTLGNLVSTVFETSVNSQMLIDYFDEFATKIVKKTIAVLDNSSLHTSRKFKAKIKEWEESKICIFILFHLILQSLIKFQFYGVS